MPIVTVYARYSSDNQRQESIDAQLRAIRKFCEEKGYTIAETYIDEAQSATTDDRPAFLRMIADARKRSFEYVIVHKLDRFARNRFDSAFYRRDLKQSGVKILSVLEQFGDGPEAVMMEAMLEGYAEYYSLNLAREVKKGQHENALKCLHNGGVPPFGYDVLPDKTYALNEHEAEAVQMIFAMFNAGHGYAVIAQAVNDAGYRTKRGLQHSKGGIMDILRNEKYRGVYIFNRRLSKAAGNRIEKAPEEIVAIEGGMPRIISDDVWHMAQERLSARKETYQRLDKTRLYILTGLLSCGICGAAYTGASWSHGRNGVRYYQYACTSKSRKAGCENKNIRADLLERYILSTIRDKLLTDEAIESIIEKLATATAELVDTQTRHRKAAQSRIDDLEAKLDRLMDLYLDGKIDKDIIAERSKPIEQELNEAKALLASAPETAVKLDAKRFRAHLRKLRSDLLDADDETKSAIVGSLIDRIAVFPDKIDVALKVESFG